MAMEFVSLVGRGVVSGMRVGLIMKRCAALFKVKSEQWSTEVIAIGKLESVLSA